MPGGERVYGRCLHLTLQRFECGNPNLLERARSPPHGIYETCDNRNYAFAGRSMRETPLNALSMTGQNSSTIASVVIEPTRPFDQNTFMSPPEPIIDRRNASSARLPSTSASVNGARGMPIFLNTWPT